MNPAATRQETRPPRAVAPSTKRPGLLPRSTFYGFCIASIGGPLALSALYAPNILADTSSPPWLVALVGWAIFGAPVLVWLRYSRDIASSGGLFAFTRAAAGPRIAALHGAAWIVSYFLYLPYTVTYVVYDLLPTTFPGIAGFRPVLEIALPVALVAAILAGRALIGAVAAAGILQLPVVALLAGIELGRTGSAAVAAPAGIVTPALTLSLLFVCGSLPLYLGGEVEGGAATVRRGVGGAYVLVGAFTVAAAATLDTVPGGLRAGELPGQAIAASSAGHALGTAVGAGVALSVVALIGAEYVALSRLGHALTGLSRRAAAAAIALPFVGADVMSLINPERFYSILLRPSLVALYVAQLIAVLVYPLFRLKRRSVTAIDVALWAGASALMGWGLWLSLAHPPAS